MRIRFGKLTWFMVCTVILTLIVGTGLTADVSEPSDEKKIIIMSVNDEIQLTHAPNTDQELSLKTALWSSGNEGIVTVNDGLLRAVGVGETQVSCDVTWSDDSENHEVWIVEVAGKVKSFQVKKRSLKLDAGGKPGCLEITATPKGENYHGLKFTSDNEQVATVDQDGYVQGIAAGKATITVAAADKTSKAKPVKCQITVVQPITELVLSSEVDAVAVGKNAKLKLTVIPENAEKQKITWSSSDKSVLSVQNGTVSAKKSGTATVTATTKSADGTEVTTSLELRAYVPIKTLKIGQKQLTISIDQTSEPLTVTIAPKNATYQTVQWISENEAIAKVDDNGRVTGIQNGNVNIIAKVNEGVSDSAKTAAISVTVKQTQATSPSDMTLSFSTSRYDLAKGKSLRLDPILQPENTKPKKLNWSVSDKSVLSINKNGQITGKKAGFAFVRCETTDGSDLAAECTVFVYQPVKSLTASTKKKVMMLRYEKKRLVTKLTPADATNKQLIWTSSNKAVAEVDDSGMVTAKSTGECVITAETTDGSKKKCTFNIAVDQENPVMITSIDVYYLYRGDRNCLFITPYNNCKYRTVKEFTFRIDYYNRNENLLGSESLVWNGKGFPKIKPHKHGDSKSWHWYNMTTLTAAYRNDFTVVDVVFEDGEEYEIPVKYQTTKSFF